MLNLSKLILTSTLGHVASAAIAAVQYRFDDDLVNKTNPKEYNNNGSKLAYYKHEGKNNRQKNPIVILFCGNYCPVQDIKNSTYDVGRDYTTYACNYAPFKRKSSILPLAFEEMSDHAYKIAKQIMDQNPGRKFIIKGHSLGGAVATLAMEKLEKERYKALLINDRSFSSITDILYGQLCKIPFVGPVLGIVLYPIIKLIVSLSGMETDIIRAYNNISSPKMVFWSKKDTVITAQGALGAKVTTGEIVEMKSNIDNRKIHQEYLSNYSLLNIKDPIFYNMKDVGVKKLIQNFYKTNKDNLHYKKNTAPNQNNRLQVIIVNMALHFGLASSSVGGALAIYFAQAGKLINRDLCLVLGASLVLTSAVQIANVLYNKDALNGEQIAATISIPIALNSALFAALYFRAEITAAISKAINHLVTAITKETSNISLPAINTLPFVIVGGLITAEIASIITKLIQDRPILEEFYIG